MGDVGVVRRRPDYIFLFLSVLLLSFGLLMIYSATSYTSQYETGNSLSSVLRQSMWIGIGIAGMICMYILDEEKLKKFTGWYFVACIVMLVLVLFVGREVNGAKSWFGIGSIGGQPTEFAKLGLILYLSLLLSKKGEKMKDFKKGLMPALVITSVVLLLVFRQPDLGSCIIIVGIASVVVFIGGAHMKHVLVIGGIAFIILTLAALVFFMKAEPAPVENENGVQIQQNDYRANRITCWLNPMSDPRNACYQTVQSLFALSHGGIWGAGIGNSVEKTGYLPEAHNDFIAAIIAEELGFVGMTLFLLTYLALIWRGIILSLRATSPFLAVSGIGIMSMFAIQAVINIGGVSNAMPMTGITLPLISAGGSSLIVCMMGIGIILSISRGHLGAVKPKRQRAPREPRPPKEEKRTVRRTEEKQGRREVKKDIKKEVKKPVKKPVKKDTKKQPPPSNPGRGIYF